MVKIRLRRMGAKKQPIYRVVIADARSPRDGRFIETIGEYHPRQDPPYIRFNLERLRYWLSTGAQPSESVTQLMRTNGTQAQLAALVVENQPSAAAAPSPAPSKA
ncbi:MAG: 30S ribosomal protein S16 [Chloroflexi bacterium]|nr:30S ribosomal protein S16 [Chloroflexota bacterium]